MKKIHLIILSLSLCFSFYSFAQDNLDLSQSLYESNNIDTYFGYSNIAGENYVGMRLQPTLKLGKLGLGLNVPVLFNVETGKFKSNEYKDGVGLLRLLRFLSWGTKKRDNFYIRVGELSNSYLGYGNLINNYTNTTSYEKSKIGAEMDICFNDFLGLEVLYSDLDFSSLNLLGIRPYVKPLYFTSIPIVKTTEFGVNYITDHDQTGEMIKGNESSNTNTYLDSDHGIKAYGFDLGVTLLDIPTLRLTAFSSYSIISKFSSPEFNQAMIERYASNLAFATAYNNYDNGHGFSYGLDLKFSLLGNLAILNSRLERLNYSDNYLPHFFNTSYEINKDERIAALVTAKASQGTYGELGASILDKITVVGNLMIPDNISKSSPAQIKMQLDASKLLSNIQATATYYKGGITNLGNAFSLDQNSLLTAKIGYKIYPFLIVGTDYRWTWAENEDGEFKASHFVTPYVALHF